MNAVPLSRSERLALVLTAVALLAVRLPFLPATLEDIDSVNFDLGVHDFNPLLHQPHPPGYTVYIAAAKLVHPFFASHAQGLAVVSALFGAALILPLVVLMRRLLGVADGWLAGFAVVFTPLVWFNGVQPMSDTMGLFAVLSAMALLVAGMERRGGASGETPGNDANAADRLWYVGAVVAGLSLGIRLQAVMLVGPLLIYGWIRQKRLRLRSPLYFALGVAVWLIPLIVASGGPAPLWRAFVQLVRDAAPVEPLLNKATWHLVGWAAYDSFVAPWGPPAFGRVVVVCALVGAGILAWSERSRLGMLALLFLPYTTYHFFLQWTDTLRYALPIVPALAALATVPFVRWRRVLGFPLGAVGAAYVAAGSFVTVPALEAYRRTPSPPTQAIAHLAALGTAAPEETVISGYFTFNRYLPWLPAHLRVIRPVPRVEWRLLADYWKQGGRLPVYFLSDPMRTNLLLIDPDAQHHLQRWTWPASVARLVKGSRPIDIELVRIDPPDWFAESGFFITDEAGPVASVEREPHRLYVRAASTGHRLIVSGDVAGGGAAEIRMTAADATVGRWRVERSFSIQATAGPAGSGDEYVPVTLVANAPLRLKHVSLEAPSDTTLRPDQGFYMPERDEKGVPFQWMGPEAIAIVRLSPDNAGGIIRLRGQVPVEYYDFPVRIDMAVDDVPLATHEVTTKDFEIEQDLPAGDGAERQLRLRTSRHFVPDDREKNGDTRRLSARVYELRVDPNRPRAAPGVPEAEASGLPIP